MLLEKIMKSPYQIYCDMDGVLCDFNARFEHFTGLQPSIYKERAIRKYGEEIGMKKFWDLIDVEVGVRYWRGMSWMPEGKMLWGYIKPYKPILLTSPSRNDNSRIGKSLWVEDNLGNYKIQFSFSNEKQEYAGPNNILIDDRKDIIMNWKAKNGIGFHYTGEGMEDIIRELKKLGI